MAKVQQKSEKVTAFGGYFSFWTINPYSEDIVKAWLDNEKKIGDGSADLHIFFFCFYYG